MAATTQWYLCQIQESPKGDRERLSIGENLAVTNPDIYNFSGVWTVWLPIIPRVGDTLQFSGWQVQVSKVVLQTDWTSPTGEIKNSDVSAVLSIRDNVIPGLMTSQLSIEATQFGDKRKRISWEDFANRGHDLEYYAWDLKHPNFERDGEDDDVEYYRWHSRIRPVAGDVISIHGDHWKVISVELASANSSVDGWLTLEAIS